MTNLRKEIDNLHFALKHISNEAMLIGHTDIIRSAAIAFRSFHKLLIMFGLEPTNPENIHEDSRIN